MRERWATYVGLAVGGVLLLAAAAFAWVRSTGRM